MKWETVHEGKKYRSGNYELVRWRGFQWRHPGGARRIVGWFVYNRAAVRATEPLADVPTLAAAKRAAKQDEALRVAGDKRLAELTKAADDTLFTELTKGGGNVR